jgi:uncharacterized protein with NRDE domain
LGNILFFMYPGYSNPNAQSLGLIIGDYLQDSSWPSVDSYLRNLTARKSSYKPFNFVQLAMSPQTGKYSLYYLNNSDTKSDYQKMNTNDADPFFFSVSNSDLARPFNKVKSGEAILKDLVRDFKNSSNTTELVNRLFSGLIQNTDENFPDTNLQAFMNTNNLELVRNVSKINADYGSFWKNGHTRTSTVILVDYDDNVRYYELNLTSWKNETDYNIREKMWTMNAFKFKLNPLYKQANGANGLTNKAVVFTAFALFFKFVF